MIRIVAKSTPPSEMRYETVGDWQDSVHPDGSHLIVVDAARSGDWRVDTALIIHEIVEAVLCVARGVEQEWVDAYDKAHLDSPEPGDEPDAPYAFEHGVASAVERMVVTALGISWKEYEETVSRTDEKVREALNVGSTN